MSKSNTPSKNRTPKSNKKEKWVEDEDTESFTLSSDPQIKIDHDKNIIGLRISGDKPENVASTGLISTELNDEIFFISPQTMELGGILVGDLCRISNGEKVKVGLAWPRQSQRLSSVILSNGILKELKPAEGESVIVSKIDRR